MDKPWFSLELKEHVARKMNRTQYYAARSWLRLTRRIMLQSDSFERNMKECERATTDALIYGIGVAEIRA